MTGGGPPRECMFGNGRQVLDMFTATLRRTRSCHACRRCRSLAVDLRNSRSADLPIDEYPFMAYC
jgi:hypothetical protein